MKSTNIIRFFYCCLIFLLCNINENANTFAKTNIGSDFYVSPNGNNANSGTVIDQSWQTIQQAMNHATPNSTVHILGGTYNEALEMNVSGLSNTERITFQNYQNEEVIIDGAGLNADCLLLIANQHYLTIKGLTVRNNQHNYAKGIYIRDGSDGIQIIDCKLHQINFSTNPNAPIDFETNSNPFLVWGNNGADPITDIRILGCEIYDNRMGYSEALSINGNVEAVEIGKCTIYNNTNIAIDLIGGYGVSDNPATDFVRNARVYQNICYNNKSPVANGAGVYVDGARNVLIENNTCYHGQYGIEVGAEENGAIADLVTVRNNLIYGNESAGLTLGGYDFPSTGKVTNTIFTNNTLIGNNINNDLAEIFISYAEGCYIENNIIYATQNNLILHVFDSPDPTDFNYNCWWTPSGNPNTASFSYYNELYYNWSDFQNTTGQGSNAIFASPIFVSPTLPSPDIHLQSQSPCINAGLPAYQVGPMEQDYFGNNRILNNQIDIGAVEYAAPSIRVRFKVFLEGAYLNQGNMSTDLAQQNSLPNTSPYNNTPWNATMETVTNAMANNIVDWLLIQAVTEQGDLVEEQAALLRQDGQVLAIDGRVGVAYEQLKETESYYFIIRHRNHIDVRSNAPLALNNELPHDFTNGILVEGGTDQLTDVGLGNYGLVAGDMDGNGMITVNDFNTFIMQLLNPGVYSLGDVNADGAVTVEDFNYYSRHASHIGVREIRY